MDIWIADVTRGAVQPENTGQAITWALVIFAVMLAGSGVAAAWVASQGATYTDAFLAAYAVQVAIAAFDFFVVDWLVYVRIYPRRAHIEGVEPLHALAPHAIDSLKGMAIGLPVAGLAALVAFAY